MKVLITGGGTQEPIDQVRVLTNISTGKTAAKIADGFIKEGCCVTYVHGVQAALPHEPCDLVPFTSHASLDQALRDLLSKEQFDAVIHLAAVSDYTVESISQGDSLKRPQEMGKISSKDPLVLHLKPTRKIIHHLKEEAVFATFILIGFKLTATTDLDARCQAVKKLTQNPAINYVVHNDLHDIICAHKHLFTVYDAEGIIAQLQNATDLSLWLIDLLKKHQNEKN